MKKQNSNTVIGFDARPLFRDRDGIGTYAEQTILAAAKKYRNITFVGTIFKGDSRKDCLIKEFPANVQIVSLPFSWRKYRALAELGIWKPIDKYLPKALNGFVYLNFTALPWVSNSVKKHLVIHDATYLEYPETVSKKNLKYLQKFVTQSAKKSSVSLFTISEFSAKLLESFLKKDFMVAYPGQSPLKIPSKQAAKKKVFLFVGTLEPRKNLVNLVRAYNLLSDEDQQRHNLVIAGRDGWYYEDLLQQINNNKNIVRIINPSDELLTQVYAKSSYFIMPSIFEGFGIPVIDATKFGLPVITSEKSPMQEILGKNGAVYVNPTDINSIKNALKRIINSDQKQLNKMVDDATKNIQKFTWEQTAEKLFSEFVE